MFKKLIVALATLAASIGFAFAQVDVNKADQAALDGVKGIGPSISKKIIDERKKGGDFKDWPDLEKRVKGIGAKNAVKFSQAGLTVGNQPLANAPAAPATPAARTKTRESKATAVVAPATATSPAAPATTVAKDAKKPAAGTSAMAPATAPVKK